MVSFIRHSPMLSAKHPPLKPRSCTAFSITALFATLVLFLVFHRHQEVGISARQSVTMTVPQPSVPQPPVQQPSVEHTSVEQPSVEQPSVEQPSVEQPSVEQPSVEQPSVEHTSVEQPSGEQPSGENSSEEQPPLERSPSDSVEVASGYTCESNATAAFDAAGKPCFSNDDLDDQLIYAVKKDGLSYLYCSIPKNGCTYHLGVMQRVLGYEYEGGPTVHQTDNKDRLAVTPETLREMLADDTVHKYMVVRNPVERVLSAYLDKVERELPKSSRTQASFEKWVYDEIKPDMKTGTAINSHWRPQVSYCGFMVKDLWTRFKWFSVEEPEPYVDYLEGLLPEWVTRDGWNGKDNTTFREAVLGPRKRTGHTSEKFFEYVTTTKLFDYLVSGYVKDIDTLGYRSDIEDMRKEVARRSAAANANATEESP